MQSPAPLHSLFSYKAWTNAELFAVLQTADASAHPVEMRSAIRILNHIHVVDCIFKGHLSGVPHGHSATNTEETPALADLARRVGEVDAWYVAYLQGRTPEDLRERLRFTFTDGDAGMMTREEILLHVITHGGYHRGAVGQIMRSMGVSPPRDLYTRFLHIAEPARRGGVPATNRP